MKTGCSLYKRNLCSTFLGFNCHAEGGSIGHVFSQRHQEIVSVGNDGDFVVLDLRQRKTRLTQHSAAHQTRITSITVDPDQDNFFVTASSDGDTKVQEFPLFPVLPHP